MAWPPRIAITSFPRVDIIRSGRSRSWALNSLRTITDERAAWPLSPSVRYTGSSIAYTFGSLAAAGAFAPLIMTPILKATGSTAGIAFYVVLALGATDAAVFFSRETRETVWAASSSSRPVSEPSTCL